VGTAAALALHLAVLPDDGGGQLVCCVTEALLQNLEVPGAEKQVQGIRVLAEVDAVDGTGVLA
jgi:hypothetical protein